MRTEGRLKRGVASRTNSDCPEDGSASENHRGHLVQLRLCLIQSIKKGGMQTGEQVIQETADRLSPPRASAATAPTQKTFYCRNLGSGGAMRGACTSRRDTRQKVSPHVSLLLIRSQTCTMLDAIHTSRTISFMLRTQRPMHTRPQCRMIRILTTHLRRFVPPRFELRIVSASPALLVGKVQDPSSKR